MCIEHTVDQYIDPKSQSRKYGAFLMKMVGWVYIYSYYLLKLIKITLKIILHNFYGVFLLFLFYFSCHQTGSGFHCLLGGLLLWLFPWFLCLSLFPAIPLQHTVVRETYVLSLPLPCLEVFHLYSLSTK